MAFGLRPQNAPALPEDEQPDPVSMGGLPPAFMSALAGLAQPEQEPVPQVTIPGMILSAALSGLGSALAGRPEEAGQFATEPLVRRRAAQERNAARQSQYETQRSALLRQGAVEGEETRRAELTAGQRGETAIEVANIQAQQRAAAEQERTERAREVAELRTSTQQAIADANMRLREVQLGLQERGLDIRAARAEADRTLKEAQTALTKVRAKEIEGRAAKLTGEDLKEIRQFSRDILGQAVSTLRSTPEGEEPTLTIEFSSGPQTFEGADEIRDGILAYLDAATRGSAAHDKLLGEAQRAFAEALGETRGGSLAPGDRPLAE